MKGIEKVIEELGTIILLKDDELCKKEEEIRRLKNKIELIEQYLDSYEQFYNDKNAK